MAKYLKGIGLNVGHRRVGRLMCQNGISLVRMRKHKVTTDSSQQFSIAPNLLDRDFAAKRPQAYVKKHTKDGKSKSEIIRCLKRYIVREIYSQLCAPRTAQIAA